MLIIDFDCRFEPVDASFIATDSSCSQTCRLSDVCGLLFVTQGRVDICMPDGKWEVGAREAFLFRVRGAAKTSFHYSAGVELYSLRFRLASAAPSSLNQSLSVPERTPIQNPERLTELLRRYIAEEGREHPSTLILYHFMVLALSELVGAQSKAASSVQPGLEFIASSADTYIAAHYCEPIGTPEIARELHYNPHYLERVYRQRRGASIREAIYQWRIKESKAQLLLHDRWSVARVASMCGFSDANYFRRVFKRVTGMTPNHFRAVAAPRAARAFDTLVATR